MHDCNERCVACTRCYQETGYEFCRAVCPHAICPECESADFTPTGGCPDCGHEAILPPLVPDVAGETACGWAGHRVGDDVAPTTTTAVCKACGKTVARLGPSPKGKIWWTDIVDREEHPLTPSEDTWAERRGER